MDDLVNTYDSDLVNACDCEFCGHLKKVLYYLSQRSCIPEQKIRIN